MATTNRAATNHDIVTSEQRQAICDAFREVLSARRPGERVIEHVDLGRYGELDVQRPYDTEIHLHLNTSHRDGPALVTGEVTDCDHHVEGWDRSTLPDLGPDYQILKRELLAITCEMCALPRPGQGLGDQVMGPVEFQNTTCHAGVATFTFVCFVAYPVLRVYQYQDGALAEELGIPIGPSVERSDSDFVTSRKYRTIPDSSRLAKKLRAQRDS